MGGFLEAIWQSLAAALLKLSRSERPVQLQCTLHVRSLLKRKLLIPLKLQASESWRTEMIPSES